MKNPKTDSFVRHQFGPRTAQGQLDSNERCAQEIELSRFNFLQIAGTDFGALRQVFLGHFLCTAFTANIRAENPESVLFFAA